jgi:response regulator RpfG family c-di-GMP phosphodiesterase
MSDLQQTEHEPLSVLLVDDEENILRSLQRLLMDEDDIEVVTATSGEEGLKLLPGLANLGVIVSDQRMPGMTGALFLEKARTITPDASRIILTGYADVSAAVDAINKGGAWRYLAKPWNDEELVRVIHEALERYRIIMENRRLNALVAKQNQELEEWNTNLKQRVLAQTSEIRKMNEGLAAANSSLKNAFKGVIALFSELINMRDEHCRRHARHVREMAEGVARILQLPNHEQETIATAAMLHDIGELGIPEHILAKAHTDMSSEDFSIFSMHPVRGQAALDSVEQLREIGILIRHHHEHFDGSGFPDGLKGEEIPLGARIIAYADYIDVGMRERYGEWPLSTILDKANQESGRKLDPSLASVFKKVSKFIYFDETKAQQVETGTMAQEMELIPSELRSGQKVSRDIYSGAGHLLLKSGTILDDIAIRFITRCYNGQNPPATGIFVIVGSLTG